MTTPTTTNAKTSKPRRKRIRARFVDGREAMQGWGYAYARCLYVIDALGIAKQDDWNCSWFAVKPEALKLSDNEFALAVADGSAGSADLDWNPYERYIIDFCDKDGNVGETIR